MHVVGIIFFLDFNRLLKLFDMRKFRLLKLYNMCNTCFARGIQLLLHAVFALRFAVGGVLLFRLRCRVYLFEILFLKFNKFLFLIDELLCRFLLPIFCPL